MIPPIIEVDALPENDRAVAHLIQTHLFGLIGFAREFSTDLQLFRFAIENKYFKWRLIAARDAGMQLYHFGSSLEAINHLVRTACPSVAVTTDLAMLAVAGAKFRDANPRYEAVRHIIGHTADFMASPKNIDEHRKNDGFKDDQINVAGPLFAGGNLHNDVFKGTFAGKMVSFEMNEKTLTVLQEVTQDTYLAFRSPLPR